MVFARDHPSLLLCLASDEVAYTLPRISEFSRRLRPYSGRSFPTRTTHWRPEQAGALAEDEKENMEFSLRAVCYLSHLCCSWEWVLLIACMRVNIKFQPGRMPVFRRPVCLVAIPNIVPSGSSYSQRCVNYWSYGKADPESREL
jgi:hypothetical protein